MDFDDYSFELKTVYEKNPVVKLQELYAHDLPVEATQLISLLISIKRNWEVVKNHNVQCTILIDETNKGDSENQIKNYNFIQDLGQIIQSSGKKSMLYVVDNEGHLINKEVKDEIPYQHLVDHSKKQQKIIIFCGIQGLDVLINGVPFQSENRLDSYSDVINYRSLVDISHYKELLEKFFHERIQFDPFKSFFVYKGEIPKDKHKLLDQHPKLLKVKPEERFQREFEYFLKKNCLDKVLTEVRNKLGERYDVWVVTRDDRLYVFEIKWLGKSITAEGNIFDEYKVAERALEGAYQLKKYIDDSETYSRLLGDFRIYCGILLTYDAREQPDDFNFPDEFQEYPQLDLYQHFKVEKESIAASQYYKRVIKA